MLMPRGYCGHAPTKVGGTTLEASSVKIDDDGFAAVTIGAVTQDLDLYRVYNRLIALDAESRQKFPGEEGEARATDAYLNAVCEMLAEFGYGVVSHRLADKFDDAIFARVAELKKADAPTPA